MFLKTKLLGTHQCGSTGLSPEPRGDQCCGHSSTGQPPARKQPIGHPALQGHCHLRRGQSLGPACRLPSVHTVQTSSGGLFHVLSNLEVTSAVRNCPHATTPDAGWVLGHVVLVLSEGHLRSGPPPGTTRFLLGPFSYLSRATPLFRVLKCLELCFPRFEKRSLQSPETLQ